MKVTEGIGWVLVGTRQFDETVAFFRDVMGLDITEEGVPAIDTQFARYAQIRMPNGVVLEIVDPVGAAHLWRVRAARFCGIMTTARKSRLLKLPELLGGSRQGPNIP